MAEGGTHDRHITTRLPRTHRQAALGSLEIHSARGRSAKLPVDARTGKPAKTNDPATWCSFAEAEPQAHRFSGLGIVLTDGLAGVDLDDCRDPKTGS